MSFRVISNNQNNSNMKRITIQLEFIAPDDFDTNPISTMTLDEINEENWENEKLFLDKVSVVKIQEDIKLDGEAYDYFNNEGVYAL